MNKDPSEIAKLTERISKDPKSKLFVPLAEEYKKAGDIEMAVHVLTEGLKHNPGYVTAKSFLGRLLMEKGDFPAAQREFEDVVKAIPDNLLAQRKLGDLYALQDNQSEALKHYKVVLALNPGDEEFAALVSDLESGVDVKPRLQLQKTTKPAPEQTKKPEKQPPSRQHVQAISSSPAAPATESKPGPELPPHAETVESSRIMKPEEPAGTGAQAAEEPEKPLDWAEPAKELATPSMGLESEEPEEVLVVEPLDEENPLEELPSPGLDFFAEKTEERAPSDEMEERFGEAPAAHEPRPAGPDRGEQTEPAPSISPDREAALLEETPVMPEPALAGEFPVDQSDDFTTDTLAELYIAQGFFEKAIDIYQRMLADHPNSRGLKDKLERVNAMAASGQAPVPEEPPTAEAGEEKTETGIFTDLEYMPEEEAEEKGARTGEPAEEKAGKPREYPPAGETAPFEDEEVTLEAELLVEPADEAEAGTAAVSEGERLFAEAKEYRPATEAGPEDGPKAVMEDISAEDKAYDIFMPPAQEAAREKPLYNDFEPREYIPPDAEPRKENKEKAQATPKQPATVRKETIDRLENWLKNIAKEK